MTFVGGVEVVDADVEGAVQGAGGLGVVARPVREAHAHAAQADGGHTRSVAAQPAVDHAVCSISV